VVAIEVAAMVWFAPPAQVGKVSGIDLLPLA
jgi:hypothetical protein